MSSKPLIIVNGIPQDQIPAADRGLHYGDGLFETILVRCSKPRLLKRHLQRLHQGCQRLKINLALSVIEHDVAQLLSNLTRDAATDWILKIIITRGVSQRGYRPRPDHEVTRVLLLTKAVAQSMHQQQGVTVRLCHTRLSRNTLTAGLKHLNRLEQVMARSEWGDDRIAEGLMCDENDYLIEGTMSNLFMVIGDTVCTPRLDFSGVSGVMRGAVLEDVLPSLGITAVESNYKLDSLIKADEVFLSNSVFGIWPVVELESTRTWCKGPVTSAVQTAVAPLMEG